PAPAAGLAPPRLRPRRPPGHRGLGRRVPVPAHVPRAHRRPAGPGGRSRPRVLRPALRLLPIAAGDHQRVAVRPPRRSWRSSPPSVAAAAGRAGRTIRTPAASGPAATRASRSLKAPVKGRALESATDGRRGETVVAGARRRGGRPGGRGGGRRGG